MFRPTQPASASVRPVRRFPPGPRCSGATVAAAHARRLIAGGEFVVGLPSRVLPLAPQVVTDQNAGMRLDNETPFRPATECSHTVGYAPQMRSVMREERRAWWLEKGSGLDAMTVTSVSEVVELVSFAPGR